MPPSTSTSTVPPTPSSSSSTTNTQRTRLPKLVSAPSQDAAYVTTCRGTMKYTRKTSKEVRFALGSETAAISASVVADKANNIDLASMCASRAITTTTTTVDHHQKKKMNYLSTPMRDAVLQASKLCTTSLVKKAYDMTQPATDQRRHRITTCRVIEKRDGFTLYEDEQVPVLSEEDEDENDNDEENDDDDEGEACVDDNVALLKASRGGAAVAAVIAAAAAAPSQAAMGTDGAPRLTGISHIQASLDEFVGTFGYDMSEHGAQRLNPGMASSDRFLTLLDEKNKRISLKWMVLESKAAGTMARRRDFVVVECQKRFVLPDGRKGWVQSLQSVQLPWCPSQDQGAGFVRGSIHHSGVVAIESVGNKSEIDVVVAAEMSLKGNASAGAHRAVSRRRVTKTLLSLGESIETERVERLSYLGTQRFHKVEIDQKDKHCKICSDRIGFVPLLGLMKRHSCRKCGASVCGNCSQVWQVERQRSTAMVGGGRVTTQTRVCTHCLLTARRRETSKSTKATTGPRKSATTSSSTSASTSPSTSTTASNSHAHIFNRSQSDGATCLQAKTTRPPPPLRQAESLPTRPRETTVFAVGHMVESMMPMRPTQLEFQFPSSPTGSCVGESDATTTDEEDGPQDDDQFGCLPMRFTSVNNSPIDQSEVKRPSGDEDENERPAMLRLSELI